MSRIEVFELRKKFGAITAVDGVSFKVEKGDVLAFLGPNGAGKSTTMKMLSCFLRPDSGTATIAGFDIVQQPVQVRKSLGYLAENAPLYDEMTVMGFLHFICDVRGISGAKRRESLARVLETCAIENVAHQVTGTLSKGYRRRVGLAQALVHDPEVLLLDEPTDGLDPNQKHDVRELILQLSKTKVILISTHLLDEVNAICNRTIIIANGKKLADSTPDELRKEHKGTLVEIFRKLTVERETV